MNFQKHDNTQGDDQQRVQVTDLTRLLNPGDQLGHQARRIEWCCGLEYDADLRAVLVEGGDAVGVRFVIAAMPGVLLAIAQQGLVQLLNVVFGKGKVLPGIKDESHQLGITGNLLFVVGGERLDLQIGQQALDVPVGELAAFNASGRADAFNGGDAA